MSIRMPARMTTRISIITLIVVYGMLFSAQETAQKRGVVTLTPALPLVLQRTLGYLRQFGAEMLYIKAAVFLGGRAEGTPPQAYADTLAEYFQTISQLHPKLIDSYYLSESSLPWIDAEQAKRTNQILETGVRSHPQEWFIPFFIGFNEFRYLNHPVKAANWLQQASEIKHAPAWLGHLSAILSARGGDILGGLAWLRAMKIAETDEATKKMYDADIAEFEKAARVLGAISAYERIHGKAPGTLKDLMPAFLEHLPEMQRGYVLDYKRPDLHLERRGHG